MSNKLADKTNQDKKFVAEAAPETAGSTGSTKQAKNGGVSVAGEQTSTSKNTNSKEPVEEDDDAGNFEVVDLSDPPREPTEAEKSGFEVIEHTDAPYSSRNEQADHKYKYPENFGNKNSKNDFK